MFHGKMSSKIVGRLLAALPKGYFSGATVHLGTLVEVDDAGGGTAVAVETEPTLALETLVPDPDVYEVKVCDERFERRLVVAAERSVYARR